MNFEGFKNVLGVLGILLFIQFWLGMSINLFVGLPPVDPQNFQSYSGGFQVLSHIVLGVAVLALGVAVIGLAILLKSALIVRLSVLGLFFVILAVVNGFVFLLNGQEDGFSMGMAMTFLSSFTVYFSTFYFVGRIQASKAA